MARLTGTPVRQEDRFDASHLPKKVRPNKPFFIAHLPQNWDPVPTKTGPKGIVQEVEWLPILGTIPIDPGVNGCEKIGKAPVNFEPAIARWQGRGGVVLRHGDPRLGEHGEYMATFPSAFGPRSPVYRDAWTEFDVLGQLVREECDEGAYNEFRRYLVEQRIVEPINVMVAEKKLEQRRARLRRIIDRVGTRPGHTGLQDKVDVEQGWVDALERSVAEMKAKRKAPKARRMRGRKSTPPKTEATT
jgi:hypothetical protein